MKFNSQICTTKEQSERLLALGLKKETADMCWLNHSLTEDYNDWRLEPIYKDWEEWQNYGIPAWSLNRLIEIIDDECIIQFRHFTITGRAFTVSNSLFDNIINCIGWLIEEGYFNKEYLILK